MLLLQLAKKPYVRNPFYDVASCHFLIEISSMFVDHYQCCLLSLFCCVNRASSNFIFLFFF